MSHSNPTLKRFLFISLCHFLLVTFPSLDGLFAQKPELPMHPDIATSSKKMKISLGAKIMNSTFKIRMGDYTMARTKIKKEYTGDKKIIGLPLENSYYYNFSTILSSKTKDTAYIEVAKNITLREINEIALFDFWLVRDYELLEDSYAASVFIHTNQAKDDQWVLLLTTVGTYVFSAQETILTNGKEQIKVKSIESESFGSIMQSPKRGLEFYVNDRVIAAFQYTSGGGFGFKQYAWTINGLSKQQELVILASISSMLELMQGARVHYFEP